MPPNRFPTRRGSHSPWRITSLLTTAAAVATAVTLLSLLSSPAKAAEVSVDRLYTTLAIEKPTTVRPASDFTLKTPDGQKTIRLSDYRGKVVILYFWASW